VTRRVGRPGSPISSKPVIPSATRNQDARRAHRAGFQAQLSDAIERLVDEEDVTYAELSVDRLVEAAGISRSTFYKYFKDKSGLLFALSVALQDDFLAGARAWLDLPPDATKADYREAFGVVFATYRTHRVLMRSIVESADYDLATRARFGEMMRVFVEVVAAHIRRGQAAGSIPSTRDATVLAKWITLMLERGQMQHIGPATDEELERLIVAVTDIVWKSLYSPVVV
jgi:AcrR family transcriptional regulator